MRNMSRQEVIVKSERKRLYSWSRPSRLMRTQGRTMDPRQSELRIGGAATLAFHPLGHWFQGNIISATEDAYTIHGRRQKNSLSDDRECRLEPVLEESSVPLETSTRGAGPHPRLSSSGGSNNTSSSQTSNDDEGSTCDSLDAALVLAALERLELEGEGAEALFTLTIHDYETGISHTLKDVVCVLDGEVLRLEHESLNFSSTSTSKGNMADLVISANIGPSLIEMGLTVYRGDLIMTYKDEPCFPVSLDASQWCL